MKRIRYTGEPLSRKPVKKIKSGYQKRKERREAAERNQVEGKFGQGKRGDGLNVEHNESEKFKHLSTQATNEIVCLIGN